MTATSMTATRYTKDHEWIRPEAEEGVFRIGITAHAAKSLGDLVYVELPEPGRKVTAGEACAVVESVKAAADVYAPLAGEVRAVNGAVATDPALVNRDPEGEGWFFTLRADDPKAFEALLDEAAYRAFLETL
jgi:glycine cleavage system H protein